MEPVASLTNSPWSREYLVDGSFEGTVTGSGKTKLSGGTLEAGYQIGCGITQDDIESISTATGIAGIGLPFATGIDLPARARRADRRADQDRPQARHGQRRPGGQEVVQRHQSTRQRHRLPHQGRRLRRTVLHPLVRDLHQFHRQHRRRRDLLRRHAGGVDSARQHSAPRRKADIPMSFRLFGGSRWLIAIGSASTAPIRPWFTRGRSAACRPAPLSAGGQPGTAPRRPRWTTAPSPLRCPASPRRSTVAP